MCHEVSYNDDDRGCYYRYNNPPDANDPWKRIDELEETIYELRKELDDCRLVLRKSIELMKIYDEMWDSIIRKTTKSVSSLVGDTYEQRE